MNFYYLITLHFTQFSCFLIERALAEEASESRLTFHTTMRITIAPVTVASLTSCVTACRRLTARYFVRRLIVVGLILTLWSVRGGRRWEVP